MTVSRALLLPLLLLTGCGKVHWDVKVFNDGVVPMDVQLRYDDHEWRPFHPPNEDSNFTLNPGEAKWTRVTADEFTIRVYRVTDGALLFDQSFDVGGETEPLEITVYP